MQIATCADDFLGAVLRDWVQIDPACDATEAPTADLRRLVREQLRTAQGGNDSTPLAEYGERPSERVGPCLGRPGAAARRDVGRRMSDPFSSCHPARRHRGCRRRPG